MREAKEQVKASIMANKKKKALEESAKAALKNKASFNLSGINKITGRRFTSKEIKSISSDAQINKSLWQMAENIVKIKQSQAA